MTASTQAANRLAKETSPYLLQHAGNPVDWFAWGPEAFEEARRRGVPIFLSVGYSTCYWCHVMERESFEDAATGTLMSERFVCIKVDREERPDVDDIYMAAVQLMTKRGGWPMSVWLTPPGARGAEDRGLEPFYAGTYFPSEARHGMPAFTDVLRNISDAWDKQRGAALEQASNVTAAVREHLAERAVPKRVGAAQVGQAVSMLLRIHDARHGGFGSAPKFPQPVYLEFLFEALGSITDPAVQASVRRAIRLTLDRMALGGMFDQVGGGFHRYSTDEGWLVPHFEKMLYDNGQLASVYARSFRMSGDEFDAGVLRRTLDYVLREMTSPEGAFYSAQDAEVNHREGQNYLWTSEQLVGALGAADGEFAARVYGVSAGTNFRDPHHPGDAAANVLFLSERAGADAERLGRINARLYEARQGRDQPGLDDKVIVSWNGLMIAGMADGAAALKERRYLDAARRAASFILERMREQLPAPAREGLLRTHRAGISKTPAFLEDYAMLMQGLIAVHRAGLALDDSDKRSIESARDLWGEAKQRFGDPARPGLLYDTMPDQTDLIVRTSGTYDGAMPSGPAVMLNNLIDLYELTGERPFLDEAAAILASISHAVAESPVGASVAGRGLLRLMRLDSALVEAIGAGPGGDAEVVHAHDTPVQVFASEERVVVPRSGAAELVIELHIGKGFHITAHEPGVEGLSPLEFTVSGGGVRLLVEYPKGEPYKGNALPADERGHLFVHEGLMRITLRLERTGEAWEGRPMVSVRYQACDDEACFQPMTVELDVAIDPG